MALQKSVSKKQNKSDIKTPDIKTSDMTMSELKNLIDFIAQTTLHEVAIETSEIKLHVKRSPDQTVLQAPMPASAMAMPVVGTPVSESRPAPIPVKTTIEITSPMIGTFFRSAKPDSPPFVAVGDKITKGKTVGIIEAMKLFNEIEAEVSGTVVQIMVENAVPVEFDQVLFIVEPD